MADIEKLRQDVIDAARRHLRQGGMTTPDYMRDAINALDAAETPNPWALLEQFYNDTMHWTNDNDLRVRTRAALAWHERQEANR